MRDRDDKLRQGITHSSTSWILLAVGLLLLLVMLIFVAQNSRRVEVDFLWLQLSLPVGLALLFAAVTGALAVVLVGAGRLLQLRLTARRARTPNAPHLHESPE